tara:strand:- start:238 stop:906 length:669 start_codon:yes stop_codon:yes gene_type:complete
MSIKRANIKFEKLSNEIFSEWSQIPSAIAGDCMNRQNIMAERISPVKRGMKIIGQARTVSITHGDNSALHAALTILSKGDVLVVEGGGFVDRAVWGGLMNRSAISIGLNGLVIDGSIRDIDEIIKMSLPVFAAGNVPTGPTKGGGGMIDGPISCGNVSVNSGDIIIGDDDGIAVIPLKQSFKILIESKDRIKMEQDIIKRIENGEKHHEIFNIETIPYLNHE